MQNPTGQIISLANDATPRTALVVVDSGAACPRCAAGKGCGAGALGSRQTEKQVEALLGAGVDVRRGDNVSLALHDANVLRAAIIVYGYPLIGAVAAAIAAYASQMHDVAAAVAALAGLVSGVVIARIRLRSARCLREFMPTIVARIS